MVQRHAMRAWKEELNFRDLVLKDAEIVRLVPRRKIEHAFDLKRQLRNVDDIFARVFKKSRAPARPGRKRNH
jgi:adenylosuccinate lyase